MATKSLRGQSTRRFSLGVNRRVTESLLSSGGIVATIGLISAGLTLVFTIWFVIELQQQSRVGAPLARSAAVMNASINQSLSALRGWVAYGQPQSKIERAHIWSEQIEPSLEHLAELGARSRDDTVSEQVAELRDLLQELKLVQWAIEDVANTPGNRPATVAYQTRLQPLRANLLASLQSAIEYCSDLEADQSALTLVTQLARFRSTFTQADQALSAYVAQADQVYAHNVEQQLARAREQANVIRANLPTDIDDDIQETLDFGANEFRAYEQQVQNIISLQESSQWNVAQSLYIRQAQPLVLRAVDIAGNLAETQALAMEENAQTLTGASYLVAAMALLMGLLSAGSLLVSVRLQRQVSSVLEKAKMLGQYEIERLIGRGGMGEVYLGNHAMLRRPTAIKLLRAENLRDAAAQNRFQREVKLTCQLSHPNTIEIFDYGRTPEGVFYYAMEYLDGFCVDALVTTAGPVDPGRVIHILLQACGSLREAHQRGFLHRDIKPSNMMLTDRGGVCDTLKVLDFGLVKDLSEDGEDSEDDYIAGTPRYLAPECILCANSSSPKSDIYALGAVAYFLLSGQVAYQGDDMTDILSRQLEGDLPFPSERLGRALPRDLEYVIMACLSRDPADRPADVAHLMALLNECECPQWTEDDAKQWWATWGEAARSSAMPGAGDNDLSASGIEVLVNSSRV